MAQLANEKLFYFVDTFVTFYEQTLEEYLNRLQSRLAKSGKAANVISSCANGLKGGAEIIDGVSKALTVVGLSIASEIIVAVSKRGKRDLLKKLMPHLYLFKKDSNYVKETLTNAAVEIFVRYQEQFCSVTEDGTWERALDKLAEDAVSRTIKYLRENQDESFSVETLTKGVVLGKSAKYENKSFAWAPPLRTGHTVKADGKKFKTPELFEEVDVVQLDKKGAVSRIRPKGKNCQAKCGSRLAFPWETDGFDLNQGSASFTLKIDPEDIAAFVKKYQEMNKNEEAQKLKTESVMERLEQAMEEMRLDEERNCGEIIREIGSVKDDFMPEIIRHLEIMKEKMLGKEDAHVIKQDARIGNIKMEGTDAVVGIDLAESMDGRAVSFEQKLNAGDIDVKGGKFVLGINATPSKK